MSLRDEGFEFFESGPVLVMLHVVDRDEDPLNGVQHETIYNPTEMDIREICFKHNLDVDKTLEMLRDKNPYTHTLFIDVQKYREHLASL